MISKSPSPKLTTLSHGAGCACKLPAAEIHALLAELVPSDDPRVLVGNETADDAAVYQLDGDRAIVTTADFFTPVLDDPYDFGRVAAANALSDVYAMGATPLVALNLVAWPLESLGGDALRDVLRGGADVAREAGVAIVGGHSIDDPEPKYGLAVTGVVDPGRILRNSTALAGHDLFLTKPIGAGVATTALKRGMASPELMTAAVEVMTTLNRAAAEAAHTAGASAVTDVTGFGLLGHLHELVKASGVSARVDAASVPTLPGVVELVRASESTIAGGTRRNRQWLEPFVSWGAGVDEAHRWVLCDAMTSGGLLIAAPPDSDLPGARIGTLEPGAVGTIHVE
ncbi:MAG: selenide, water dikinase [Thermoleophilaceae bacterium]|jgi:selenide,water dikinase|nr:selenide, water dikinase [Thermoleophilaceae bacterium]